MGTSESRVHMDLNELRTLYGEKKEFHLLFELPALIALSGYPELKNIRISFKAAKSNTPCATRPTKSTVFRKASDRHYVVHITTEISKGRDDVLPAHLPLSLQVALLAHELAHVCDFLRKNSFEAIGTGIFYGVKPYKKRFEKRIDGITVLHGFGRELIEYGELISHLQRVHPKDKYYATYFDYYMTGDEIRRLMKSK
jgi:hypothetical protein